MTEVFADTSLWFALLLRSDQWHAAADRTRRAIGSRQVVTTELVLIELLDGISRYGAYYRDRAANFAKELRASRQVEVIKQESDQVWAAVDYYQSRSDQRWGLTDCLSFIVMQEKGITEALTADRDFSQAGFTILMQ
jgi:predicted nucleic acid-binding protein